MMSKKDNQKPSIKKDTTTDFFLNFINRQKSENKNSEKQSSIKPNEELLNVKNKSFEFIYKALNSLNLFLDPGNFFCFYPDSRFLQLYLL